MRVLGGGSCRCGVLLFLNLNLFGQNAAAHVSKWTQDGDVGTVGVAGSSSFSRRSRFQVSASRSRTTGRPRSPCPRAGRSSCTSASPARPVWSLVDARTILTRMIGDITDWTALGHYLLRYMTDPSERVTAIASAFAASLELVREGKMEIRQDGAFQPLYMRRGPNHVVVWVGVIAARAAVRARSSSAAAPRCMRAGISSLNNSRNNSGMFSLSAPARYRFARNLRL